MNLVTRILLLAVALWLMPACSAAQSSVRNLERGSTEERLDALSDLLKVPLSQRTDEALAAVEREARRLLRIYRHQNTAKAADQDSDVTSAYAAGLVLYLGESRSVHVVPLMIEFSGFGNAATDALEIVGEPALPALIQAAEGEQNDLQQRTGALFALSKVCDPHRRSHRPLSRAAQELCVSGARKIIDGKLDYSQLMVACLYGLATGDASLRSKIEELAMRTAAWKARGLTDADTIEMMQRPIRNRLAQSDAGSNTP